MGCPTEVYLGDTLTFSVCTHDPDTGVLTDASAVPDYWIYEDETGVSINTSTPNEDVMAKLDDAHTTGLYTETITCSTANGYEVGKTYTVYIEATVDGDKGGICYAFKVNPMTSAIIAKLSLSANTIVVGTVSHDVTAATTTIFYSNDITTAAADHYNGRYVFFTSGTLQNQMTDITDYEVEAGEGKFTVTALTSIPADNVTFIVI